MQHSYSLLPPLLPETLASSSFLLFKPPWLAPEELELSLSLELDTFFSSSFFSFWSGSVFFLSLFSSFLSLFSFFPFLAFLSFLSFFSFFPFMSFCSCLSFFSFLPLAPLPERPLGFLRLSL
jgi:hypothetical protein